MAIKYSGTVTEEGDASIRITDGLPLKVSARMPAITYSGTPTHAGEQTIECIDAQGNPVTLDVIVKNNVSPKGGTCYLFMVNPDGEAIQLDLPNVQSIEETDTANITEISTIIYGFDDNFVMDVGTTQRYTVTIKRVQPFDCRDDEVWSHQHQWSNGHWFKMLQEFFGGWQNLNTDGYGVRKGGYTFHYEPAKIRGTESAADLYPVVTENVFLAGSLTASFKENVQTLTVSFPLAVSDMKPQGQDQNLIGYDFVPGDDYTGILAPFVNRYPEDMDLIMPGVPLSWSTRSMGAMFTEWLGKDGAGYDQGVRAPYRYEASPGVYAKNEPFTAQWKRPIAFEYVEGAEYTGAIPENATAMAYWIIGWGGIGGADTFNPLYGDLNGGGGGSGAYISNRLRVSGYKTFRIRAVAQRPYQENMRYDAYVALSKDTPFGRTARRIEAPKGGDGAWGSVSKTQGLGGKGGSPNGVDGSDGVDGGVGGSLGAVLDGFGIVSTTRCSTGEAESFGPLSKADIDAETGRFGHGGSHGSVLGGRDGGKGFVMVAFYE